jgi:hypothetical protein
MDVKDGSDVFLLYFPGAAATYFLPLLTAKSAGGIYSEHAADSAGRNICWERRN